MQSDRNSFCDEVLASDDMTFRDKEIIIDHDKKGNILRSNKGSGKCSDVRLNLRCGVFKTKLL